MNDASSGLTMMMLEINGGNVSKGTIKAPDTSSSQIIGRKDLK
jgi:hypothetical protein